jgi:hypothetical protein
MKKHVKEKSKSEECFGAPEKIKKRKVFYG